ncbi:MAG: DUF3954 domain-containing protein [Coriobacteriales bacterium]|nr:DUF3954 domain-containing protein [Coriobacteriales bacterium]
MHPPPVAGFGEQVVAWRDESTILFG